MGTLVTTHRRTEPFCHLHQSIISNIRYHLDLYRALHQPPGGRAEPVVGEQVQHQSPNHVRHNSAHGAGRTHHLVGFAPQAGEWIHL